MATFDEKMSHEERKEERLGWRQAYKCRYINKPQAGKKACSFSFDIYEKGKMVKAAKFRDWRDNHYRIEVSEAKFDAQTTEV